MEAPSAQSSALLTGSDSRGPSGSGLLPTSLGPLLPGQGTPRRSPNSTTVSHSPSSGRADSSLLSPRGSSKGHQEDQYPSVLTSDTPEEIDASISDSDRRKKLNNVNPTEEPDVEDNLTQEEKHFLRSVARGHLDLVEECIADGVDITVRNSFNRCPNPT